MKKVNYLIIVDNNKSSLGKDSTRAVISSKDYISGNLPEEVSKTRNLKVINLCNDYSYLRTGYYCSLLAEARGHRCVPSVNDIAHAKWKRFHRDSLNEVATYIDDIEGLSAVLPEDLSVTFFFGRSNIEALDKLGRKLFDLFRLPLMQANFCNKNGKWSIKTLEPVSLSSIDKDMDFFNEALNKYVGTYFRKKKSIEERYWLAILHDPEEKHPPSNKKALEKFIKIGAKKRFFVELINKSKLNSLLEYDALFIRASTNVNHYTYRFSIKAFKENIPCIDDKDSIIRCCNKIYLHEVLKSKNIASPKTIFISRQQKPAELAKDFSFPVVLKVPDGAFSTGVSKVKNLEEYKSKLDEIFKQSELALVQEYLFSEYDWRICVLDNKVLFVCKYHMAKKHWQIVNYNSKRNNEGMCDCVPINDVPEKVIKVALKVASLIGNGLYGIDLKEIDGKPYVIEINDNPNIDAGIEDRLEGDKIYEAVFDYFEKYINM